MKRIEFIAPVEAMRGNLSGRQKLVYALNDNSAWEAPDGRQYARNYKPRFIGAKRAKDGATYFSTRTKHAINNSALSRTTQGALAASNAFYHCVMHDLSLVGKMQQLYNLSTAKANGDSLFKYFADTCDNALRNKLATISFMEHNGVQVVSMAIDNPFRKGTAGSNLVDYNGMLYDAERKFWTSMGTDDNERFMIDVFDGVFFTTESWTQLIASNHNVLGVVAANGYVKLGDLWVKRRDKEDPADEAYVTPADTITSVTDVNEYILTEVAPA